MAELSGRTAAIIGASSFGVNAFTEGLRQQVTGDGIGVLVVEPGFVDTELQGHNQGGVLEVIAGMREEIGDVLRARGHRQRHRLRRLPAAARVDQ